MYKEAVYHKANPIQDKLMNRKIRLSLNLAKIMCIHCEFLTKCQKATKHLYAGYFHMYNGKIILKTTKIILELSYH